MNQITEFSGEYRFLSNFWPARVELDGVIYPSVENAFQAAKTFDSKQRIPFTLCSPRDAKRAGRKVSLRADWENVKLQIMEDLVTQKFTNHSYLKEQLKATGQTTLIEGNTWGDTFWGVCKGVGKNHLGKILMRVRSKL